MKAQFLKVLFDEGQRTCFTDNPKGTKVQPIHEASTQYFCINALHPSKDLLPTQEYHNPNTPRRADVNVICLRNILIEIDCMPLRDQYKFITDSGLPYSTCTFSGSKSFHFIISLENPCGNLKEYKELVERIYKALNKQSKVIDTSCKNPSRLSRMGDSIRDNGKPQNIIHVGSRINNAILESWLLNNCPVEQPKQKVFIPQQQGELSPWARVTLMKGITEEGKRNQLCFRVGCEFARGGFDLEVAVSKISERTSLSENEVYQAVRSAYASVGKNT